MIRHLRCRPVDTCEAAGGMTAFVYVWGGCVGQETCHETSRAQADVWRCSQADSKACTLRTRKFITNRLLERKQFVSLAFALPFLHPYSCTLAGAGNSAKEGRAAQVLLAALAGRRVYLGSRRRGESIVDGNCGEENAVESLLGKSASSQFCKFNQRGGGKAHGRA